MYTPWLIPEGHEYQYDLGWLVRKLLSFETELNTAIDLKTIHYADPLQWDITTQYSPNTVVVDPKTGTAYMSKKPVPAGVQLTNTDYWIVVFNYQRIYDKIMSGVAFNDKDNLEASKDIQKYDFVWFGGDLYQAQRDIPQGSKYLPDVNIVPATIAGALEAYYGRDRSAQVVNDTVTVGETQTITAKNRVVNVAGDQSVTAGDITETSTNRTIHTTADYHTDIDGNFSDHVDGVTTVNRGGAVTEVYGSSLDVGVTGPYTAEYRGGATETYAGKRNVSVQGMTLNSAEKTLPIVFPDKTVDLHELDFANFTTPQNFGAMGDGSTDDTVAFQNAINSGKNVIIPSGKYVISGTLTIDTAINIYCFGTIIRNNNNYNILDIAGANHVYITGLNVWGYGDIQSYVEGKYDIYISGSSDVLIRECSFTNSTEYACIAVSNSNNVKILNNNISHYSYAGIMLRTKCYYCDVSHNTVKYADNNTDINSYAIILSNDPLDMKTANSYITCSNNLIENTTPWWEGIDAHGGSHMVITDNIVVNTMVGIALVRKRSLYWPDHVIVSNNTIYNTSRSIVTNISANVGISITAETGTSFSITGNLITGFGYNASSTIDTQAGGIELDGGKGVIIGNNIITDCAGYGILLRNAGTENAQIHNNIIRNIVTRDGIIGNPSAVFILRSAAAMNNIYIENNNFENVHTGITGPAIAPVKPMETYIVAKNNNMSAVNTPAENTTHGLVMLNTPSAPAGYGRLGDMAINSSPKSGQPIGWVCTTQRASSEAVWTALPNL